MTHKSLHLLVMVMLFLALASPASRAVLAAISSFTPWNDQPASLVLGQPDFNSNEGFTSQSRMAGPNAVAVDPTTGKIFVAEWVNNRVLRFASLYALSNGAAAEAVLGQADFTHGQANRGGSVAANNMNGPSGISVDLAGRLWVADLWNNRVLRFNAASSKTNGADADGVLGQPDFTSNTPTGISASSLDRPSDVFADAGGHLWVVDCFIWRVLRFDNAAAKANGANADGVLGEPDFASYGGGNPPAQNTMGPITGLFVDSQGRLWLGDMNNNRVLRFDNAAAKANGANADGVLGQPGFTSKSVACSQTGMNGPAGVTGDSAGWLYVADISNNRVLVFKDAANLTNGASASSVLGQTNLATCSENTGGVSATSLSYPDGLFFDRGTGVLWVADNGNNRVLMYDISPHKASLVLGQPDFTHNANAVSQMGMHGSYSAKVDPTTGKVFVADLLNSRVLRFASLASLSNGAAAEAVLGQADFAHNQPNRGGSADANSLYAPNGIFVDRQGRLWVADSGNNRVLRFDCASAKANGANADGVLGQAWFNSNSPATTRSGMNGPMDVFLDVNGRLWVADFHNNRLLRFDFPSLGNGALSNVVLGQTDFTSNDAATTRTGMNGPSGLFVDSDGWMWVADYYNNRVLRFNNVDAKSIGDFADGVLGQADFTSASPTCSQSGLSGPQGVGGDQDDQLWIADTNNNRVLTFSNLATKDDGANADSVLGQTDFTSCSSNSPGVASVSLSLPTGAFFDNPTGVLWVADWNNNRVLLYGTAQYQVFAPLIRK